MEKLIVIIERGAEDYGAWADNIPGIYASGDSVAEVKKDVEEAIRLYKENNTAIPECLQGEDIEIEYHFDTASFLDFYAKIFSKSALERITGINQKLLGHYAAGLKKPRKPQVEKIDKAMRQFIDDLSQVHLV